jgi:type II secretory pathway pseudopilin PulG
MKTIFNIIYFTFVEILVAILILGLSLAFLVQLIGGSRARLLRAEQRWSRAHVAEQAVEFFLLAGADADMPSEFIPEGYAAYAEITQLTETMAQGYRDPIDGWMPIELQVVVRDPWGETVAVRKIEQLYREDDL